MHREGRLVGIARDPRKGSILHISWMLHNLCNQHCSYCPSFNHEGSHGWPRYEEAVAFLDRVFAHYKKDVYHVSFTGGEPTLWPDLPRLCSYLKARGCEIGITSNGAGTLGFWREAAGRLDTISLSYHPEYARNAHFLEVVRLAAERADAGVRLMMPPRRELWDRCLAFAEELKAASFSSYVFVEHVPLQEELGRRSALLDYEPWQREHFAKTPFFHVGPVPPPGGAAGPFLSDVWDVDAQYADGSRKPLVLSEFLAPEATDFFGWECRAGLDQLFIAHDGKVYRAGCAEGGSLGGFNDPGLALPVRPILCGRHTCPCGTDIMTPKRDPRPGPFRLRHLASPAYLAPRLKEIRSAGDVLERVKNLGVYARGLLERTYDGLRGRWRRRRERAWDAANRLLQPPETPFRLRKLLNPVFVARRLREIKSSGDLLERLRGVARYSGERLDRAFFERTGRTLPGVSELKKGAAHRFNSLLSVPQDALLDARLRQAAGRFSRRAGERRSRAAEVVRNPVSPIERHPPCRIHLSWNIHVACNYDCAYCWFHGHWEEFKAGNRYLQAAEWARHWERLNDRYGPVKVDIAGGEPFTYPGFLEILESVGRRNVVLVSTNLSWGVERFIDRVDSARVEIAASFHPMYARAEAILEKILRLRKAGFHANVSLVAYPEYLHLLLEHADVFLSRGVSIDIQPFRGTWKGRIYPDAYTPTARALLERLMSGRHADEHYPEFPKERRENRLETSPLAIEYQLGRKPTRGIPCNAGALYGRLQADGAVTRCAQGGYVGSFFDENFRMGEDAEPCPFKFCDCLNEVVHIEGGPRGPSPQARARPAPPRA